MNITRIITDGKAATTGQYMRSMVDRFYLDMSPYADKSIFEVFDIIKSLPFVPDPADTELLMRPRYTLSGGGDCDDKCIALAAYCKMVGIPYRFVASRRAGQPTLHHVFCEIFLNGKWIHADPTYNFNSLGREREPFAEYKLI